MLGTKASLWMWVCALMWVPRDEMVAQKELTIPLSTAATSWDNCGCGPWGEKGYTPEASIGDCCHHEPTEALPKESFSHKPKLRAPRPTPRTGLAWSHLSAGVYRPRQTQCVFKLYSGESWSICINPISSTAGPASLVMFQDFTNPSSCPAKTLAGNSFNQNFREWVVIIHCFLKSCLWNTLLLHA